MFSKGMQKLDIWDLGLTKLSVMFFALAVIARSPAITRKVQSQNPWWFLLAAVMTAIRPLYRFLATDPGPDT